MYYIYISGAGGFHGQTADAVNVAAHNSLVSGASLDNLVGVQGGFLSQNDALDANFIASQEYAGHGAISGAGGSELAYQDGSFGLVQATKYNEPKYTSGSLILDDYRLPSKKVTHGQASLQSNDYNVASYSGSYSSGQKSSQYQSGSNTTLIILERMCMILRVITVSLTNM